MATDLLRIKIASPTLRTAGLLQSVKSRTLAEYRCRRTIRILNSLQDDVLEDIGYHRYTGS